MTRNDVLTKGYVAQLCLLVAAACVCLPASVAKAQQYSEQECDEMAALALYWDNLSGGYNTAVEEHLHDSSWYHGLIADRQLITDPAKLSQFDSAMNSCWWDLGSPSNSNSVSALLDNWSDQRAIASSFFSYGDIEYSAEDFSAAYPYFYAAASHFELAAAYKYETLSKAYTCHGYLLLAQAIMDGFYN